MKKDKKEYKREVALKLEDGIKNGENINEWVIAFCNTHFSKEYTQLLIDHIMENEY